MLLSTILQGKAIVYDPAITGLTGGGATKLDGVVTVGVANGQVRAVRESSAIHFYRLNAGTLVEDGLDVVRPDDYATSTNERVWQRLSAVHVNDVEAVAAAIAENPETIREAAGLGDADDVLFGSVLLGEVPSAILPEGTLSRVGSSLRLHDGETAGGVAIVSTELDPVRRIFNHTTQPFETGTSTVKRAGAKYWDEVGRITLPAAQIADGNLFLQRAWSRIISDTATSGLNKNMLLVPASVWDYDPQSQFFGASPASSNLTQATPLYSSWKPVGTNSLESDFQFFRVNEMQDGGGGSYVFSAAASAVYGRGYDETAAARYSDNTTGQNQPGMIPDGGLEFVVVIQTTATEIRQVYLDLTIQGITP